jgi:4-amino-4-deoxy-L-arabinose transferase-like glycosyltransferase
LSDSDPPSECVRIVTAKTTPASTMLPALRREWAAPSALLGLVIVAALLRFATLGYQSFWFDEVVTAHLTRLPFTKMLDEIPQSEGTPPLYYIGAWIWSRIFGGDEFGLRSLSAVVGTATVPVVYAIGKTLLSPVVGLIAATLVAASPLLIWYSQEARAYESFVFLSSLSVLFFLRSRRRPSRRNLAWWAIFSILALLTHYFAVFVISVEGAWLLITTRIRNRSALVAVGITCSAAFALLPLVVKQYAGGDRASFIAQIPLRTRLDESARQFLTGQMGVPDRKIAAVVLLAVLVSVFAARHGEERQAIVIPLVLAFTSLSIPLVLVPFVDRFYYRNLVFAWPILAVAIAAALLPTRFPRAAFVLTLGLLAAMIAVNVHVVRAPRLQRDEWRSLARSLSGAGTQVVLVEPSFEAESLMFYDVNLSRSTSSRSVRSIKEINVVGYPFFEPFPPKGFAPPAGFVLRGRQRLAGRLNSIRFQSLEALPVRLTSLVPDIEAKNVAILVQKPR